MTVLSERVTERMPDGIPEPERVRNAFSSLSSRAQEAERTTLPTKDDVTFEYSERGSCTRPLSPSGTRHELSSVSSNEKESTRSMFGACSLVGVRVPPELSISTRTVPVIGSLIFRVNLAVSSSKDVPTHETRKAVVVGFGR
ncbi:hypothetical protein BLNAU_18305 [Blattamonas nauphoetae]|uniref:Uncharacterized protein n=1 Tax=Blattamonas nauphoetae TaxID=2049346 RepID=A0ABQ9X4T8_9EUKA|nr:hypothetical protein BLNAU_18305 [Blattamonas nauphoetae]